MPYCKSGSNILWDWKHSALLGALFFVTLFLGSALYSAAEDAKVKGQQCERCGALLTECLAELSK